MAVLLAIGSILFVRISPPPPGPADDAAAAANLPGGTTGPGANNLVNEAAAAANRPGNPGNPAH